MFRLSSRRSIRYRWSAEERRARPTFPWRIIFDWKVFNPKLSDKTKQNL